MSHSNPSDQELKELLTNATTIAIVGASSNPDKASYGIMQKLQKAGYKVIPVNPAAAGQEIMGQKVYGSLDELPQKGAEFLPLGGVQALPMVNQRAAPHAVDVEKASEPRAELRRHLLLLGATGRDLLS